MKIISVSITENKQIIKIHTRSGSYALDKTFSPVTTLIQNYRTEQLYGLCR